jgi:CO/xanthine dehydrogenase Mo-binding subunit
MSLITETADNSRTSTKITRRGFVKIGGALFVSALLPPGFSAMAAENETSLDPTALASWLEIRSDNTIVMRTGRTETGTGASGYYAQAIAEELNVRPETISLIMGDTDKTPDGGYSAGFLSGMSNVRKVAAYTHQALLGLAAVQFGVAVTDLTVTDGVVSGGGKSISYGQLVQGQHLELKIPVEGKIAEGRSGRVDGCRGTGRHHRGRRTSDEDGEPVQGVGHVLSRAEHFRQGDGQNEMELRRRAARHATCAHGAAGDIGLDAYFGWRNR